MLNQLRDHICLYASFDTSVDADISRGHGQATLNADVVCRDPDGGRHGGSLVFSAATHGWAEDELTFPAPGNFPYDQHGFSGTISLWLSTDPDADLSDDVPVDPFHISRHPSDASFYLDLTRPHDDRYGSPRKLRFGFYNDSLEQNRLSVSHFPGGSSGQFVGGRVESIALAVDVKGPEIVPIAVEFDGPLLEHGLGADP